MDRYQCRPLKYQLVTEFHVEYCQGTTGAGGTLETRCWKQQGLLKATTRKEPHQPEPVPPPQPGSRAGWDSARGSLSPGHQAL